MTSALNFDTADCHITGGCDVYTTKAARSDRKLYKNIEHSLEAQYESVLRLSASLTPPNAPDAAASLNLSRSSPFGPLSEHSSRRTFAYLIATLNASHPDYDFSQVLRPSDFRRERSFKKVLSTVDSTLFNLRPRESAGLTPPASETSVTHPTGTSSVWSPRMWRMIEEQMSLRECSIYSYVPEEDASNADDGAIWSIHYFFFNRLRKRVCYLYIRAIPILSHMPLDGALTPTPKRMFDEDEIVPETGPSKRARYWFGDSPEYDRYDEYDAYMLSDEEVRTGRSRNKGNIRAMSEEIAESMEV